MRPEPLELTLQRASSLGYTSIELAGEPDKYPADQVKELLQKYNMTCWGTVTIMHPARDLISSDSAKRASTVDYMKAVVELCAALNGKIVTIVPSTVGKIRPEASPEQEWAWAVEGLKSICALAKSHDIRIALEPLNRFETYFLNRTDQALALADEVGTPDSVGVAYDPFHLCMEEKDMYAAIGNCTDAQGRTRIYDVHLGDNNRLAPGDGSIDWKRLVSELKRVGYEGGLAFEAFPPTDRTPVNPGQGSKQLASDAEIDQMMQAGFLDAGHLQFLKDHASGVFSDEYYRGLVEKSASTILPLIKDT